MVRDDLSWDEDPSQDELSRASDLAHDESAIVLASALGQRMTRDGLPVHLEALLATFVAHSYRLGRENTDVAVFLSEVADIYRGRE